MKKYLRGILCLVLALCMAMCFVACDDSDEDEDDVVGTYYFYEMEQDGETITAADLEEQLESYAEYMEEEISMSDFFYMELKKNGTGVLCMMGEEMEMEWDEDFIWPEGEEDEKVEYTFKNGKFTMEQDDTKIVLKKK